MDIIHSFIWVANVPEQRMYGWGMAEWSLAGGLSRNVHRKYAGDSVSVGIGLKSEAYETSSIYTGYKDMTSTKYTTLSIDYRHSHHHHLSNWSWCQAATVPEVTSRFGLLGNWCNGRELMYLLILCRYIYVHDMDEFSKCRGVQLFSS